MAETQGKKARILVIDDDPLVRRSTEETLKRASYEVVACSNGEDGISALESQACQLVLCDMKMPGLSGLEVLERVKALRPGIPFIIITAYGTVETAVTAIKKGAYHFIEKPFASPDELELLVARALEYSRLRDENKELRAQLRKKYQSIGKSTALRKADELVRSVAGTRSTVLVTGESGTGKELIARAIYMQSPRNQGPFVKINCAALPETLIESELFGHRKGAFTGALRDAKGKFELASGGTLLLDEIGEMPIQMQSKLLRVLQEREIDKIGGEEPVEVDVRIIATTNRDLRKEIAKGNFREDLFYRLSVVPIHLPSLRERKEDIEDLVAHFIREINEENGFTVEGVDAEALAKLKEHDWPGNIRELENALERAVVLQKTGKLSASHFTFAAVPASESDSFGTPPAGTTIAEMEKRLIYATLSTSGQNRTRAAEALGISIRTLRNKLQEYEGKKPVDDEGLDGSSP